MDNQIVQYFQRNDIVKEFSDVLGDKNAQPYIASVLLAVAASDELMKCSPRSIQQSALRAASLGLSCDPAVKQAWIVPYSKNIGTREAPQWVKEAQFQPHYKGLYTLAMRTGKYWIINVSPVYEGQRVMENNLTGLHSVVLDNGLMTIPDAANPAYTDVTIRRKKEQKIIGWIGYFKTTRGMEKSVWMSSADIEDHEHQYVKNYEKNPNWSDPAKRPVMEMKTVLRQLLSWADLTGTENAKLAEALRADTTLSESPESEIVDAESASVMDETEIADPIDPLATASVKFYSDQFQITPAKAEKQIRENPSFTNPMPKTLFKKIVTDGAKAAK